MSKALNFALFGVLFGGMLTLFYYNSGIELFTGKYIVDVSNEAIYIKGHSCTVNTEAKRPLKEISKDMEGCISVHKTWLAERQ